MPQNVQTIAAVAHIVIRKDLTEAMCFVILVIAFRAINDMMISALSC